MYVSDVSDHHSATPPPPPVPPAPIEHHAASHHEQKGNGYTLNWETGSDGTTAFQVVLHEPARTEPVDERSLDEG